MYDLWKCEHKNSFFLQTKYDYMQVSFRAMRKVKRNLSEEEESNKNEGNNTLQFRGVVRVHTA